MQEKSINHGHYVNVFDCFLNASVKHFFWKTVKKSPYKINALLYLVIFNKLWRELRYMKVTRIFQNHVNFIAR